MTRRVIAAMALIVGLSGCGFLSRTKSQYYSLETLPGSATASASGIPVGLDAIELPPGLDRRDIVVRGENHQLEVRGTQQWAASLEDMVIHTLAFDLASRVPEGMIVLPGQAKPASMRALHVLFEDLAPGPDRVFVLDAHWRLGVAGGAQRTGHERITVPMDSDASASVASAMSQALAQLADRLAAAM